MKNVKPANLVVVKADGSVRVELVDLGRDWVKFEPTLWTLMTRRPTRRRRPMDWGRGCE